MIVKKIRASGNCMSKKDFMLETMEDLENLYYGKNNDPRKIDFERRRRYDDSLRNLDGEIYEKMWKDLFESCGYCLEKIKEKKGEKTPDFICKDGKFLVEVTSIQDEEIFPSSYNIEQDEFEEKLINALDHCEPKFQGYAETKVFAITLSIMPLFRKIYGLFNDHVFDIMNKYCLEVLLVAPEPMSYNGKDSSETWQPLCFINNPKKVVTFSKLKSKMKIVLLKQ